MIPRAPETRGPPAKARRGQPAHVFITGVPGSGKTTLARVFLANGKRAIDGDLSIGMWLDGQGRRVRAPPRIGRGINRWAERRGLTWKCDEARLLRLLQRNRDRDLFLFGGPTPPRLDMFDRRVWLKVDAETVQKRLRGRVRDTERYHNFGATESQRASVVRSLSRRDQEAVQNQFEILDASKSPEELFSLITGDLGPAAAGPDRRRYGRPGRKPPLGRQPGAASSGVRHPAARGRR